MILNKISIRKKRSTLVDIYIDDEFFGTIPYEFVLRFDLYEGKELDETFLIDLLIKARRRKAYEKACDYLSFSDLTAKRLSDKLIRFGISRDDALWCVQTMQENGYIDDRRYAKNCLEIMINTKLWGPRRVYHELKKRGVPDEIVREMVELLDEDWVEIIIDLLKTTYQSKIAEYPRTRNKLIYCLASRGYEYDDIYAALSRLLDNVC